MTVTAPTASDLRRRAEDCWGQRQPQAALQAAWAAFDLGRDSRATKRALARLLQHFPAELNEDRCADYLKLLTDHEVEPDLISTAGWRFALRRHERAAGAADGDAAFAGLAAELARDELVLTLLRESPVYHVPAERLLTRLRRWQLLSGQWRSHGEFIAVIENPGKPQWRRMAVRRQ